MGGEVVYWTGDGGWSESFSEATAYLEPDAIEATLAVAEKDIDALKVIDVYPFDVTNEDGILTPVKMREHIRAKGPTVRLDLGKQAETRAEA